ncbi:DUF4860 domain-containing protein [Raoultibacter phocaeensis]|uniref:DUF4860 domain-containing protein n=1 Tax=Raoultibacter phocaeensis TaxID=2479841 RepID=UPI0021035028|nr:DUF4860 domain-containing protein [Raoultibacter phocaeensis]
MTEGDETVMDAFGSVALASRKSKDKRLIGRVFTALLLALFVVTLLMAIMVGTGVYRSLYEIRSDANETRLGLNLIANSVRANDAVDAVAVGAAPEGRSLVLMERLESGTYETRIYLHEGMIVEEYALADAAYTPDKATKIVASDTFDFAYENSLLTVMTDQGSIDIALRSVKGGA